MVVPVANLSAVVTGAAHRAQALAMEMLPAAVTREAVGASMAWLLRHLWSWLVAARGVAVENLPVAASVAKRVAVSVFQASEPWRQMAAELLHDLYVWLLAAIAAAVENLPDAANSIAQYTVHGRRLAAMAANGGGVVAWPLWVSARGDCCRRRESS
ncbi:hypothetical protein ABZP36_017809 [Zizania latifolia]